MCSKSCSPAPRPSRPLPAATGGWDSLSVVVCARNEARCVVEQLQALADVFPGAELLLVDNGSTDATPRLAASVPGVRVVAEPRAGKGNAMRTGAAAASREWLLFHDADGEYAAGDAAEVVRKAMAGGGAAVGTRLVAYDRLLPSSWLANSLISLLLRVRTGVETRDVLSGTRCLRRGLFLALETTSAHFGIETEITRKLAQRGVSVCWADVRFTPRSRAEGKKIRPRHLLALIHQALRT
ncbi:Poly-beta-1,6-N-acetyl-D-glucosamine synthase [compost metagenome]